MNKVKGPTVPSGAPKVAQVQLPQSADMEHFHRLATSGALSDMLLKLGGGKRK